jgi:hypothetical protein
MSSQCEGNRQQHMSQVIATKQNKSYYIAIYVDLTKVNYYPEKTPGSAGVAVAV